jgi:hypothetical protein
MFFNLLTFESTWRYSRMFFNLLTFSVPDVTQGCFSVFWLWSYLTLLQDVFQSFDFQRTWRYSRMFFNLLTLIVPDVLKNILKWRQVRSKSIDWKKSWSNVRYAQSQKIEKHPGVTSGTLKVKILKSTWRYSRMFFNLLTLSVPDVTPGCFSIFWFWAYLTLL